MKELLYKMFGHKSLSKEEAKQTISVKEFTIIGAIGGFVVVVGISLILYLIAQIKKTKKTLV